MKRSTYVLGTGVSHDGSACLLKDGRICVAIEKERLTRVKHDGGNDSEAIKYCLKAAGITIDEVDLIVQNANFGSFKFGNDYYEGPRLFGGGVQVPVVTISHHLAHAYSAVGTCPFDAFNILVMDGCGNSYDDCTDIGSALVPDMDRILSVPHLMHEKDSYYRYSGGSCNAVVKDFSEWGYSSKEYPLHPPTTKHSIGGLYQAVSVYCFGNIDDPGKLMGLGPYGRAGIFKEDVFELKDGRVFVDYGWMEKYRKPARSYEDFKNNFQYYADMAYGIQREVERAILYVLRCRLEASPADHLCYCGGTALNAVANAKIADLPGIKQLYIEPAAGDNGLSLGCAFYGWLEVLKKERCLHNGSTCFGVCYPEERIRQDIINYSRSSNPALAERAIELFFDNLDSKEVPTAGTRANIQFRIEDIGNFQVLINGSISCGKELSGKPTCVVQAGRDEFCTALIQPSDAEELIGSGKIKVSNSRDLELLFDRVGFASITGMIREQLDVEFFEPHTQVNYSIHEDYIGETARLLSQGKIVGWFQDGCEFGPRALGRRSILADPRNPAVRNFINAQIKFREDFRPFAPSILREDVALYFEKDMASPYMIMVDRVREEYREVIRSVIHEDGSGRIQTVTPEWNGKYYELLQEFKKLTGLSVLLNTSFNRRGMPIVETPKDAIEFFFSCKLDCLVMGRFIINKNGE